MPIVPCRSLTCRVANVTNSVKKKVKDLRKKFVRFGVFAIILLEGFSLILALTNNYTIFIYDFLVQFNSLLFISILLYRPSKLVLCCRKKLAYNLLSLHYLIGVLAVTFKTEANEYYSIIGLALLSVSAILIYISLRHE